MKRLLNKIAAQRWLLWLLPVLLGSFLVVGTTTGGGGNPVGVAIAVVLLAVVVLVLALNLAGADSESEWVAESLTDSPLARALLERWLRRSKYYRLIGSILGLILSVAFINNGGLGPALVGLIAGMTVGAMAAEVHVLRRSSGGPQRAELATRQVRDYVKKVDTIGLLSVVALAIAVLTSARLIDGADVKAVTWAAVWAAIAAVSAWVMQRQVVLRRRPVVDNELREADDLLRRLAATMGFTRPAIALGFALLARAVGDLGGEDYNSVGFLLGLIAVGWYVASRTGRATSISASFEQS